MIFFKLLLGLATIAIIIFNIVKGFTPEIHPKSDTNTSIHGKITHE